MDWIGLVVCRWWCAAARLHTRKMEACQRTFDCVFDRVAVTLSHQPAHSYVEGTIPTPDSPIWHRSLYLTQHKHTLEARGAAQSALGGLQCKQPAPRAWRAVAHMTLGGSLTQQWFPMDPEMLHSMRLIGVMGECNFNPLRPCSAEGLHNIVKICLKPSACDQGLAMLDAGGPSHCHFCQCATAADAGLLWCCLPACVLLLLLQGRLGHHLSFFHTS